MQGGRYFFLFFAVSDKEPHITFYRKEKRRLLPVRDKHRQQRCAAPTGYEGETMKKQTGNRRDTDRGVERDRGDTEKDVQTTDLPRTNLALITH